MVDEENAFQMVVLVLDARRHQPGHAFAVMLAVRVLPVDGDLGGARHFGILLGDRQAAFLIDAMLLALVRKDGVDEHARLANQLFAAFILGIGFLQVDDEDALRHPDLDRRQPDAGASYIVSNMSATSCFSSASNVSTGLEMTRSRGSGVSMMGSRAMGARYELERPPSTHRSPRPERLRQRPLIEIIEFAAHRQTMPEQTGRAP